MTVTKAFARELFRNFRDPLFYTQIAALPETLRGPVIELFNDLEKAPLLDDKRDLPSDLADRVDSSLKLISKNGGFDSAQGMTDRDFAVRAIRHVVTLAAEDTRFDTEPYFKRPAGRAPKISPRGLFRTT
jgi:hypothetical protein